MCLEEHSRLLEYFNSKLGKFVNSMEARLGRVTTYKVASSLVYRKIPGHPSTQ